MSYPLSEVDIAISAAKAIAKRDVYYDCTLEQKVWNVLSKRIVQLKGHIFQPGAGIVSDSSRENLESKLRNVQEVMDLFISALREQGWEGREKRPENESESRQAAE